MTVQRKNQMLSLLLAGMLAFGSFSGSALATEEGDLPLEQEPKIEETEQTPVPETEEKEEASAADPEENESKDVQTEIPGAPVKEEEKEEQQQLQQQDDTDTREKAIVTIDLAKLTEEEWADCDYISLENEHPEIDVGKLLQMVGKRMNEGKTKEQKELEDLQTADTPNDGSGYLFTAEFADNAQATVEDRYRALEAFVADRGKIILYAPFEEGQILYQDDKAILMLVLKCNPESEEGTAGKETDDAARIDAGVVVESEAGSFLADTPVKQGTVLVAEKIDVEDNVAALLKNAAAAEMEKEPEEIHMVTYAVSLVGPDGAVDGVQAAITLKTQILLPEAEGEGKENTLARAENIRVVQVNDDASLTVLDAEAEQDGNAITEVRFTASAIHYFAVCYTVGTYEAAPETDSSVEEGTEEDLKEKLDEADETAEKEKPDAAEDAGYIPVQGSQESAQGVTVEVIGGNAPEGAEIVFEQLDSFSAKQLAAMAAEKLGK